MGISASMHKLEGWAIVCELKKWANVIEYVWWNLIFIGVEHRCGSLFVRVVITFADKSRLVDNSREFVNNVRDKQ